MPKGQITVVMDGKTEKLFNGFRRLVEMQSKMEQGLNKYGQAGDKAGKKTESAFRSATAGLKTHLAGLVNIQAGYQALIGAVRELDRVRRESSEKLKASERGLGSLAELSGGDPKKLNRLIGQAKHIYSQGGASSLDEAARSIYAFESAGVNTSKTRRAFGKLYGIVSDPAVLARAIATIQTSKGAEAGTTEQLISKALAANKYAPASAPEILEAASRSAAGAKMLGISDEEMIAATAVLAKSTGTAELGGTQLDSLIMSLATNKKLGGGFKGLSLIESLQKLEGMGLSDVELKEALGRKEAVRGFAGLRDNIELLRDATKDITGAQDTNLFGRMIEARSKQAEVESALMARRSAANLEISRIEQGVGNLAVDAQISNWETKRNQEGANRLVTLFGVKGMQIKQSLGGGDDVMETIGSDLELAKYREMKAAASEGRAMSDDWSTMGRLKVASERSEGADLFGTGTRVNAAEFNEGSKMLLKAATRTESRNLNGTPDEDL